ncbi:MAG: hypothetical protein NT148_02165, partial [Candidatus Nealsonbacteria bacterium]|nr:hypothetical protein [Candidatus Nealsonbacteria bacterium]
NGYQNCYQQPVQVAQKCLTCPTYNEPVQQQNYYYNQSSGSNIQQASTTCPGIIVKLLAKKSTDASSDWKKDLAVVTGDDIEFLVIVINASGKKMDTVTIKSEIPKEVSYTGNLKVDGASYTGSVSNGVNIGSIEKDGMRIITFNGGLNSKEYKDNEKKQLTISSKADTGTISATDTTTLNSENILKTQTASVSSGIKETLRSWYVWFLVVLVIVLLYFFFKSFYSK